MPKEEAQYSNCKLCGEKVSNTHGFWFHNRDKSLFCSNESDDMAVPNKVQSVKTKTVLINDVSIFKENPKDHSIIIKPPDGEKKTLITFDFEGNLVYVDPIFLGQLKKMLNKADPINYPKDFDNKPKNPNKEPKVKEEVHRTPPIPGVLTHMPTHPRLPGET